jgi:FkbM family methyltransferase
MSLVDGAQGDSTAEDQHVEAGLAVQGLKSTFELNVPARTLASVLEEHGSPRVDLLSLDVEGFERQALEGLGLTAHRPRFIVVEARFEQDVDEFLTGHDYQLLDRLSFHDLLYADRHRTE